MAPERAVLFSCRVVCCQTQSPVLRAQLAWPRSGSGLHMRPADMQLASACPNLRVYLLCTSGLQHSNSYRGTDGYDLGSRRSGGWRDVDGPQSPVQSHSYGAFERRSSESNSHQNVSYCCPVCKCRQGVIEHQLLQAASRNTAGVLMLHSHLTAWGLLSIAL